MLQWLHCNENTVRSLSLLFSLPPWLYRIWVPLFYDCIFCSLPFLHFTTVDDDCILSLFLLKTFLICCFLCFEGSLTFSKDGSSILQPLFSRYHSMSLFLVTRLSLPHIQVTGWLYFCFIYFFSWHFLLLGAKWLIYYLFSCLAIVA